MGYQVLARKYRPQRFADVAGQDHVTRTLLNALTQNRVAHGYIFSGHRGIGKTTIARILAMALNCRTTVGSSERPTHEPCLQCVSCREISSGGNPEAGELTTHSFDFIEIDAASNRGIDDVRSIRTQATVQPARDRYKIFLLDEAHQITEAAFNAILKTLEEPPEWTIFMMATTEPENIPQTIRSRCQHFSFHAVKFDDILAQLKMIAAQEQVEAEEAALALLAEAGDGSMRDALSIMDQAIASAPCDEKNRPILSTAQIRELMGSVPNAVFERLLEAVAAGQSAELMEELNVLLNAGHSPSSLARQMVRYLRNALMAKLDGEQTELLQISADERARVTRTALLFTEEDLTRNLQIVLRTFDDLNYRQEQRFHLELGLLKLIHAQRLLPLEELLSGVAGASGVRGASTPTSSTPRPAPPAPRQSSPLATTGTASPPASTLSPFAAAGARTSMKQSAVEPIVETVRAPSSPVREIAHFPVVNSPNLGVGFTETVTEGSLAKAPQNGPTQTPPPSSPPSADAVRNAICAALTEGGFESAALLLGAGEWTIEGASVRIEVAAMGKKMLSLTVNASAEKLIRQELQRLGASSRFLVVPGASNGSASAAMPTLIAGSVQQEALNHPLVQRAKEIFHAEVRSVVDLRVK
ncbi:MAG: DNA polymerase III subunit gamma/tau [Terracidiphilus sp.]